MTAEIAILWMICAMLGFLIGWVISGGGGRR